MKPKNRVDAGGDGPPVFEPRCCARRTPRSRLPSRSSRASRVRASRPSSPPPPTSSQGGDALPARDARNPCVNAPAKPAGNGRPLRPVLRARRLRRRVRRAARRRRPRTRRCGGRSARSRTSSTAAPRAPTPRPATAPGFSCKSPHVFFARRGRSGCPEPAATASASSSSRTTTARRAELEAARRADGRRRGPAVPVLAGRPGRLLPSRDGLRRCRAAHPPGGDRRAPTASRATRSSASST